MPFGARHLVLGVLGLRGNRLGDGREDWEVSSSQRRIPAYLRCKESVPPLRRIENASSEALATTGQASHAKLPLSTSGFLWDVCREGVKK